MYSLKMIVMLLFCFATIVQHRSKAAQSLDDLFPFGLQVGDTLIPTGDDNSYGPILLPYMFPYFDNNHRQIYQATNGLFSFLGPISNYNPISFPLGDNQRLITPFWSDIDTRGWTGDASENSVLYHIYTRDMNNSINITSIVFTKAASMVRQYFPREMAFEPKMIITGTWYRVGYYSNRVDRLNTFQMVLVTDEDRSFVFFLYNDLQWGSKNLNGPYAQAGFNAGDGFIATMLKYSRTSNITLLVNETNVNVPGIFAFRVDTTDVAAGGCTVDGSLSHIPVRGPQIGGTTVKFQGPCFNTNSTEMICRFGDFGTVHGLIINEFRAVCVSPLAEYHGTVDLTVSLNGGRTFISSGSFTYMPMTDDNLISEEIIVRQNGSHVEVLSWNDTFELEWQFPESLLTESTGDTFIDIEYFVLKRGEENSTRRWKRSTRDVDIQIDTVVTLASNIRPQPGRQTVEIDLAAITQRQHRLLPLRRMAIGAIRVTMRIKKNLIETVRAVKSLIKIIKSPSDECDTWSNDQPDPSTWNQNLLPCPNTHRQAQVARNQYEPDKMCQDGWYVPTFIPVVGNCWYHQGRPDFNEDSAVACYRSVKMNEHGAGGQCCYNRAGQIITRGTGAGSDDRYHSGDDFWGHQFSDVLPFVACCKLQSDPDRCDKYLKYRPSRPGSDTMGQFGGTWGDPHFLTLDGTSYTFNGYGEYIYMMVPVTPTIAYETQLPVRFQSQIRTVPIGGITNEATFIKAFAAGIDSQKLSFTISRRDQLLVHLNGDVLTFDTDSEDTYQPITLTHRFEGFSVTKNLTNDQYTLVFEVGVSFQVTPIRINTISSLVLNVAAAVSGELKGNWTLGLIGGYDGNPSNDMRDSSGTIIGTVDTLSLQEIHQLYGVTWAINPTESLFFYESGENAQFYTSKNAQYRPSFSQPTAGLQEWNAREACGIDINSIDSASWSAAQRTCYYDVSITGDLNFGRVSRQAAEEQVEQREAIRNPPKFNSALSLTQSASIGQKVSISFTATSEFTSSIAYQLLDGPTGALFNVNTAQFEWKVPTDISIGRKIPVKISATDSQNHLMSTYEVVLEIQAETNSAVILNPTLLLMLAVLCFFSLK